MVEKLCVFCEHMRHESGGYGEYAEADRMDCGKGHWRRGVALEYDLDTFRLLILKGQTCHDYSPPK